MNQNQTTTLEVNNIINKLKEINMSNSIIYYDGILLNYKFHFNEPANNELINTLEREINYSLPEDYKQLLLSANGINFESEASICNIEEVLDFYRTFNYPKNLIVIATCLGSSQHIVLNLEEAPSKCIYVIEPIGDEYFYSINSTFGEFLNRFVTSYGDAYWNFHKHNEKKIPKTDWVNLPNSTCTQKVEIEINMQNKL